MKHILTTIIFVLIILPIISPGQKSPYQNSIILTKADSIYAENLPKFTIPEEYKSGRDLPTEHDNSILPFFRPSFPQGQYWSCGQGAGVGYNFTYEINVAREADATLPENQYSPHFTYNFLNNGNGWGANYFYSFDIIKSCGNPNQHDYGELSNEGYLGWKSGYEIYENAMRNRITDVYSIDVSTPEGILTLKQWLIDHANGSEYGGLANFYLSYNYPTIGTLPANSPDAYSKVIYSCGNELAGHALTIYGFNDSIRYDINNDGQYTNDIDLNGDNIIDMKDWEWGGFKTKNTVIANSDTYIMYRTLALEYLNGGIWNQQTHIIKVDADYEPVANFRLKVKHNARSKIKIIAGVSTNMEENYPQHTIDFPIFNYQGGEHYMQGIDSIESEKELELALDISPLFTYLESGQPAKFYVQIAENDIEDIGQGEIQYFSLVTNTNEEVVCNHLPVEIANNAVTTSQLTYIPNFDKVEITTDELAQIETGATKNYNLSASGGYPPYRWNIVNNYVLNPVNTEFEPIDGIELEFDNTSDSHVNVELPFGFPFYGDTLYEMSVFIEGFIMFEDKPFPYPYFIGEETIIKNNRIIAPFASSLFLNYDKNDGVWVDKNIHRVIIRWKTSSFANWIYQDMNFNLYLYPDGSIETHYGNMTIADYMHWAVGISSGDKTNFTLYNNNQLLDKLANSSYVYTPISTLPEILTINNSGDLSVMISDPTTNYPIEIQVSDSKGIKSNKTYNLSAFDIIAAFQVNNDNNYVSCNEVSNIHANITNRSNTSYEDVILRFRSRDPVIVLNDTNVSIGNISAGETIELDNIASFSIIQAIPDRYNASITCELITSNGTIASNIDLIINAPVIRLLNSKVIDDDDIIYPGETGNIRLTIQNTGHAKTSAAYSILRSEDENIYIPFEKISINELNPGDTLSVTYTLAASWAVPMGETANLNLKIYIENSLFTEETTSIRVGKIPVLIYDLNPNQESAIVLHDKFNEIGLRSKIGDLLMSNPKDYMSIFVCLGDIFNLQQLTGYESEILVNYLESLNGNIYLEGREAWKSDENLPVFDMFNIEGKLESQVIMLDTIVGLPDTYTKELTLLSEESYYIIDYFLQPIGSAKAFLKTKTHDSSNVSIAYDAGAYKTIGSNIQFKYIVDSDPVNNRENYLLSILEFFGLKQYVYANVHDIKHDSKAIATHIFPNPANNNLTIELTNTFLAESNLQIFNLQGNMVYNRYIPETSYNNSYSINWDCTTLGGHQVTPGLYFIIYSSNNIKTIDKIIIK